MELGRGRTSLMVATVVGEGGLFLLGWLLIDWWGLGTRDQLTWSPRSFALGAMAALPMYLFFLAAWRWRVPGTASLRRIGREVIAPLLRDCSALDLVAIAVIAGVGEELLFRGALQPAWVDQLGPVTGITAASLAFGLIHAVGLAYAVFAVLCGAWLGMLVFVTADLSAAMIAHALYDALALIHLARDPIPAEKSGDPTGNQPPSP